MKPLPVLACAALLIAAAMAAAACRRPSSPAVARPIRVGYAGDPGFADLPSLVAHARLRSRGYRIERTSFSSSGIAVAALSDASVDVIHASMITAWIAASRGAHLRTVMDHVADPYRLIAAPGMPSCAALHGRRLALAAEGAVTTHLVRAFLTEECPAAQPETLVVPESASRAAAFLAGRIDAGPLELSSWLWLEQQAPGRFAILSDFSKRWPAIRTTGVHVNTEFARDHPDIVRAYLRELLAATRDATADPSVLVSTARDAIARSEDWPATARAYIDAGVWPEPGGFRREDVASTLAFFKTYSGLDPQLTVDAVADLGFLEWALADSRR